jgi:L-ascorbate metabolism protein UlaG (beta-lactamase superfamily)
VKPAFLKDAGFLADVEAHRGQPGLRLWWLGQSGFLVHYDGRFALFDPYLSDSLTRKYAATDKPHVRMTERVVDPARLT